MSEYRELTNVDELNFEKMNGLIQAIAIDPTKMALEGILMSAYANREAVEASISTGLATYWSRSRDKLWVKGETSNNYQRILNIYADCDGDTIIYSVMPFGPACHLDVATCFIEAKTRQPDTIPL